MAEHRKKACKTLSVFFVLFSICTIWVVDILKVGGYFATAILRFFTFFRFSGFSRFLYFFLTPGSCSAENFTSKTEFLGIFFNEFEAGIAKNQNIDF